LGSELDFDWDTANLAHIARHQISAEEAEEVIRNEPLDIEAETLKGEDRMTSVGRTNGGRFLVVVTTLRETRLRVVTAFAAPPRLIGLYFAHKGR
jgi:uncharacterized protein